MSIHIYIPSNSFYPQPEYFLHNSDEMKRTHPEGQHGASSVKKRRKQSTLGLDQSKEKITKWYEGRLCPIKKDNAWFIRPSDELPPGYEKSKDVFMHPDKISKFVLPVVQNDMLEFLLGERDKTKPMARKVRVSQYSPRTYKDLIEYIRKLNDDLKGVLFENVLTQILPCTAMWRFLGSPNVFQNKAGS